MIRLSKNKRYKLFEIVRLRDRDLWDVYERMLGIPYPAGRTHVHHVIPVASGGEDIAENLLTLDPKAHFYVFHTGFGSIDKEWQQIAQKYLESEEVKALHEEREASLTALYQTAETTRIKKIRKNCLPEKKTRLQILREDNTICPVCHRGMKHACHCPKEKAAVCEEHCETCEYHVPMTAASNGKCLYTKKPPAGTGGEG